MRIAIYGTGGVGGYFGGVLARSGQDVTFIARGEHLKALQNNGLAVHSIKGDFHLPVVKTTDKPGYIGQVDVIFVAVKAWQVPEIAPNILPMLAPHTVVIPLCNGVEAQDQLGSILGKDHVLGGLCRISTFIAAPGVIQHAGIEPYIAFAPLAGEPTPTVKEIHQALLACGLKAEIPGDILAALWEKFIFIVSVSGLGAITRMPSHIFRSIPETRQMLLQAMQEVYQIAVSKEIKVAPDIVGKTTAFIDSMGPGVMASMQRDIMENKPSELDAQCGTVVRLGIETGVPVPVNTFIYHALLPQELKARGKIN